MAYGGSPRDRHGFRQNKIQGLKSYIQNSLSFPISSLLPPPPFSPSVSSYCIGLTCFLWVDFSLYDVSHIHIYQFRNPNGERILLTQCSEMNLREYSNWSFLVHIFILQPNHGVELTHTNGLSNQTHKNER